MRKGIMETIMGWKINQTKSALTKLTTKPKYNRTKKIMKYIFKN